MESFKAQFRAQELPQTPADLRDRAVRFFDYLRGQHALRDVPVRDVAHHDDRRWWESDFPAHSACRLRPEPHGPWLSVNKVPIPVPPNPPAKLDAVLDRHFGDPAVRPGFVEGWVAKFGLDASDIDDLEARLRIWLADEWEPWAERAKHANTARSLYQDLFDLHLRLLRQDSEFELLWGHGFLTWKVSGEVIRSPVALTPCSMSFNADSGEIDISADGASMLDFDFLRGLAGWSHAQAVERLNHLRDRFREQAPDVWDGEQAEPYYRDLLELLAGGGDITAGDPAVPTEVPVVTTRSLLFVRRRVPQYTRFFERMRELIVDGHPVPLPLRSVLTEDPEVAAGRTPEEWVEIASRLLLPLPSNAEQDEIARSLAGNDMVTVQGPPGTGKTHTIANLASHLLAHGKRVLITSFKQQPLEILRDMIPEEIRPLCVSVLGSSTQALEQIEKSVHSIQANVAALDTAEARARIVELEGELDAHLRDADEARRRLEAVDKREVLVYILGDRDMSPAELAQWLATYQDRFGFIPDPLSPDDPCPLTRGEIVRYFELCAEVDPEDLREGIRHLPDWGDIPDGPTFRRKIELMEVLEQRLEAARELVTSWDAVDDTSPESLREVAAEVSRARDRLAGVGVAWLDVIGRDVAAAPEALAGWETFVASIRESITEIVDLRGRLAEHQISLPEGVGVPYVPSPQLDAHLQELRRRHEEAKRFRMLMSRELRDVRESCSVDGRQPGSVDDYDLLLDALRLARRRYELRNRWNHDVRRVGGPQVGGRVEFPEQGVGECMAQLAEVLDWERSGWPGLRNRLVRLGIAVPDRCGTEEIERISAALDAAFARQEYMLVSAEVEDLADVLRTEGSYEESSPLFAELARALSGRDGAAWEHAHAEVVRLDGLRMRIFEADELGRRLAEAAPVWAARIAADRGDNSACGNPSDVDGLWQWRQADTWLSRLVDADDPVHLEARFEDSSAGVLACTRELVDTSAWLQVSQGMTEIRRRSLAVWAQALQRARDAEGPTLSAWRAEAEAAMRDAVEAIPAWIMPIYRVVDVFDPAAEPFDVVIVDESSQCDLFSMAALSLGKKAVVVGDDMQMSPQTVVVDEGNIQNEIRRLIHDVPHASLLEPHASLYDVAKRSCRGAIVLREHFRCLPEIISFSNDLAYDGRILPLRERNADPDWIPIMSRFVPDGFRLTGSNRNPTEAAEIVELIATLCADAAYEGRTMGVVSLLGDEQAHTIEEALISRLGEAEMNRRRLRCGDPYQFQGDERDVMFISMVVARDDDGLTNRPFIEDTDRQSVNVAASRARDQVWLFHSVAGDQLHPHDVRGQLVRFFADGGHTLQDDVSDSGRSTDLERTLAHAITARGYRVRLCHQVGRLTLDLVVEGQRGRLAVEVAGPSRGSVGWTDDRKRREVLERLGWRFHHIRGSEFHRGEEATLAKLWARLDHLGVHPFPRD